MFVLFALLGQNYKVRDVRSICFVLFCSVSSCFFRLILIDPNFKFLVRILCVDLSDWCSSSSFIYLSMIDRLIHSFIYWSMHSSFYLLYVPCHELPFIWCRFVMSCHVNACRIHVKNLKFLISEFSISALFAPGSVLFPPYYYLLCSNQILSPKSRQSWVESSRG